jgi:hypothetical protein
MGVCNQLDTATAVSPATEPSPTIEWEAGWVQSRVTFGEDKRIFHRTKTPRWWRPWPNHGTVCAAPSCVLFRTPFGTINGVRVTALEGHACQGIFTKCVDIFLTPACVTLLFAFKLHINHPSPTKLLQLFVSYFVQRWTCNWNTLHASVLPFLQGIFDKQFKKNFPLHFLSSHPHPPPPKHTMPAYCKWILFVQHKAFVASTDLLYMWYTTQTCTFPRLQRREMTQLSAHLPCLSELVFPYARGTDFKDNGMSVKHWWNDTGRVKSKYSEKETCLIPTLSKINLTCIDRRLNWNLRG